MKWISFKKWSSKTTKRLIRKRIYKSSREDNWTPITQVYRRHKNESPG